ncbi:ES1 protein homolog, mitochondrial isoform X2 [Hydra vulgaris]|uniref:ES1 protein homolog, mitochondrial isoform X2 n=1 Tax=Hydra vulgaris TaxID=6087 RepID=A0ABM4BHB9_HYDVU
MASNAAPNVAVVLSGCGVYDGSEVHEASAVLVNLSRNNAEYKCFAPDIKQMHVIDHLTGQEMKEERNVLIESGRIARGDVQSLEKLSAENFDAVIFPGGFGAAKNLCNFAVKGTDFNVNEQVERVIKDFHTLKKPIGLCCIAPVIAAKVIPSCEVTVGMDAKDSKWPYADTAHAIGSIGATHINKNVNECHVDKVNKLVTTPAFMCNAKLYEVHDGIGEMVKAVLQLI